VPPTEAKRERFPKKEVHCHQQESCLTPKQDLGFEIHDLKLMGWKSLEKRWLRGDLRAAFQCLKGPTGRMERGLSQGCAVIGQGGTALN